jgi:hypothetical protein
MGGSGRCPYGPRMGRTRTRMVLGALSVALAAAALVGSSEDEAPVSVGTHGRPTSAAAPPSSTPEIALATTTDLTSTTVTTPPRSRPRTSAPTTSSTSAPTTTPPAVPNTAEVGTGPHDLLGRLVYLQEDSNTEHSLMSARLDGTDQRQEVDCPSPEAPPPSVQPSDYWIAVSPFDISPDGTHVVRSCLVRAPATTGRRDLSNGEFALVVQDVDGVGSTELWRYDLTTQMVYPSWSPDGSQIVVWTQDALILIRPDGSGKRVILPTPSPNGQRLTWSPDGKRLVTDSLEVLDIATGTWSLPMREHNVPWPYPGGYSGYGVVAWKPDGIWFVTEFTNVLGAPNGPETKGLYRLDPNTGVATQALKYDQLVYAGELAGQDVYGLSVAFEPALVRISPDGVPHAIPVLNPMYVHVPTT